MFKLIVTKKAFSSKAIVSVKIRYYNILYCIANPFCQVSVAKRLRHNNQPVAEPASALKGESNILLITSVGLTYNF